MNIAALNKQWYGLDDGYLYRSETHLDVEVDAEYSEEADIDLDEWFDKLTFSVVTSLSDFNAVEADEIQLPEDVLLFPIGFLLEGETF